MFSSIVLGLLGIGFAVGVGSSVVGYAVAQRVSYWWRGEFD